jgi:hypothetical protein
VKKFAKAFELAAEPLIPKRKSILDGEESFTEENVHLV